MQDLDKQGTCPARLFVDIKYAKEYLKSVTSGETTRLVEVEF